MLLLFSKKLPQPPLPLSFISSWKTDNPGTSTSTQTTLPLIVSGTYDMEVDWGDGSSSTITAYNQAEITHTYSIAGTYTVTISGTCHGWRFNSGGDRRKIVNVSQCGILRLSGSIPNLGSYFSGCSNLTWTATDTPDLTDTNSLAAMFLGCLKLTNIPNLESWPTASIISIAGMLNSTPLFNGDIAGMDLSSCLIIDQVLAGSSIFNKPFFASLPVCTNASEALLACAAFNQPLASVYMPLVTQLDGFLSEGCIAFNNSVPNAPSCQNYNFFLYLASSFNHPSISNLNMANATQASYILNGTACNRDVSGWSIGNCITFEQGFTSTPFSTTNYDKLLNAWVLQPVQTGVLLDVDCQYTAAAAASRLVLTGTKSWPITDGGLA